MSPIFDINPNPDLIEHHVTALDGRTDTASMAAGLLDAGGLMGVDSNAAQSFIAQVYDAALSEPAFTPRVRSAISELQRQVTDALPRVRGS